MQKVYQIHEKLFKMGAKIIEKSMTNHLWHRYENLLVENANKMRPRWPQEAPKSYVCGGALGPGVPGRGKEFLTETPGSKFAIGLSSSYKQTSGKQTKKQSPRTSALQLTRTGVPEGTVRIYTCTGPLALGPFRPAVVKLIFRARHHI